MFYPSINLILVFIDSGLIKELNRGGFDIGKSWSILKKIKIWIWIFKLAKLCFVVGNKILKPQNYKILKVD